MRGFGFGLTKRSIIGFYNKSKIWDITASNFFENYKDRVIADGGTIDDVNITTSTISYFLQRGLKSNTIFAWNEFAGAKDNKAYNLYGTTDLIGTQTYDRGMMCFNGTDQKATIDITGYNTVAIAYRTYQDVIITSDLTGLGEISGNTLHLGSNAAETEFYAFDMLALVVLFSNYQLVESYLEVLPLGEKEKYFDFAIADGSRHLYECALTCWQHVKSNVGAMVRWIAIQVQAICKCKLNTHICKRRQLSDKILRRLFEFDLFACHSNSLTDVSGWSALTDLTYLSLLDSYNSLTDVSGWSALTNLTYLLLPHNSLTGRC